MSVLALAAVLLGLSGGAAAQEEQSATALQQEQRYVEAAVLEGVNGPACVRDVPATIPGAPPASLLSILSVLRAPASSTPIPDGTLRVLLQGSVGVYSNYVRLAQSASGNDYYVFVADGSRGGVPPANVHRCIAAQAAGFRAELPRIAPALQAPATSMLDTQLRSERRHDEQPAEPGVFVVAFPSGGGGGGADAAQIEQQGVSGGSLGASNVPPGETTLWGVVPDGVATVTLHYPACQLCGFTRPIDAPAVTIQANVVNNVVVASVPRIGAALNTGTITWLASDGTVIKTLYGQL